jgi:excisionase family DNA binding protein
MSEPWVSVDEVANHLGVTKDSAYRRLETEGLPAHRFGGLWTFKLSEQAPTSWKPVGATKAAAMRVLGR